MKGVIFLDIDGVLLTGQSCLINKHLLKNREKHSKKENALKSVFDPIAIQFLNRFCELSDFKIVIHSNWRINIGKEETYKKLISEGIKENFFHQDYACPIVGFSSEKSHDIHRWLDKHRTKNNPYKFKTVIDFDKYSDYAKYNKTFLEEELNVGFPFIVIDDEKVFDSEYLIKTDYFYGLNFKTYSLLCGMFGVKDTLFDIYPLKEENFKKIFPDFNFTFKEFIEMIYYRDHSISHLISSEAVEKAYEEYRSISPLLGYEPSSFEDFMKTRINNFKEILK